MTADDPLINPPAPPRHLYTINEVADMLRTTPGAIRVRVHRGQAPPSVKIGSRRLFPANQLTQWITQQEHTQ